MNTYTDCELYDMLANQADPEALIAQDADEMAEQLAELIGNADATGTRYPDDGDGTVDLYAIVAAIKRQLAKNMPEEA